MRKGSCQCGQVRFEYTGDPINQVFSYCTACQEKQEVISGLVFGCRAQASNLSLIQSPRFIRHRMSELAIPIAIPALVAALA